MRLNLTNKIKILPLNPDHARYDITHTMFLLYIYCPERRREVKIKILREFSRLMADRTITLEVTPYWTPDSINPLVFEPVCTVRWWGWTLG